MSLPTPPTTSHREKENKGLGSRGVVWSQQDDWQVHCLSTPPQGPKCSSAHQDRPVKSILKVSQPLLPLPEDNVREETPAPSDPLTDPKYLETPISTILSEDATISDLIRAYSILVARIRPCVGDWTDHSSPLFEPLRVNRDILCERICRDVKRALVDTLRDEEEQSHKEHRLPSPTKSPKKKKRGMTAEQAKHARDLCTVSHSVLKLLGLLFGLPNVCPLFTDQQLTRMMGSILSIPLAPELPTPNARKTYALSIFVIQTQRLPEVVLLPAKDSIACALGRGIDGELGKEGKKGSASDGLKAIHDLSIYQPSTFVPAFVVILDSILDNLLAPTLALRLQACHALGGLAQGTLSLPLSAVHARISSRIVDFLLTVSPRLSPKKNGSPTPAIQESAICRTLRTTLNVDEEPLHVAQGPVWGLHVLSSFIILLRSTFRADPRVTRTISNLMFLCMRNKKVAVRKLGCIVWRTIIWSWHQLPFPLPSDDDETAAKFSIEERKSASTGQWAMIEKVLSMGVGVSTCCAIVDYEVTSVELMRLERILSLMVNKSEDTREDALLCIIQLVNLDPQTLSWDIDHLISKTFLSGITGFLATADYAELSKSLHPIREELPDIRDLRSLTRDELLDVGAMKMCLELWSSTICIPSAQHNNEDLLVETWDAMLKSIATLAEADGEQGESKATQKLARALYGCLRMSAKQSIRRGSPAKQEYHFDLAKNLRVVHRAWVSMCTVLSSSNDLEEYATELLDRLVQFEDDELNEMNDQARIEWAGLCVDLILASEDPSKNLTQFWAQVDSRWIWSTTVRTTVWTQFVQTWQESKRNSWEGSLALLCAPFCSASVWDLNDEELSTWEKFLTFVMNRGMDYGYDPIPIVDSIASRIQQKCNPTFISLGRIADMLISSVFEAFRDISELPEALMDFVVDTLNQSYPPSPSTVFSSMWMIRSLRRLLDFCPGHLCLDLLEMLQEAFVRWISDEMSALVDSYDDIISLYEDLLMKLVDVAPPTLKRFEPILEALFVGPKKPLSAFDALDTFVHTPYFRAILPQFWPKKVSEYVNGPSAMPFPVYPFNVAEPRVEPEECHGSIGVPSPSRELSLISSPDRSTSLDLPSSPALEFPDSPSPSHPRENHVSLLLPAPSILSTPPRPSKARISPFVVAPTAPGESGPLRLSPLFTPETPSRPSKVQPHSQLLAPSPIIKPFPPASPLANKRRRISEKENQSPCTALSSSPLRRDRDVLALAQESPSRRLSTIGGKRLFAEMCTGDDDKLAGTAILDAEIEKEKERPTKRVRMSAPIPPFVLPLPPKAPITEVSGSKPVSLSPKAPSDLSSVFLESDASSKVGSVSTLPIQRTASRKRKAMILDCVEIVRVLPLKKSHSDAKLATEARPMKTPTNRMSKKATRKRAKSDTNSTAKLGRKTVSMMRLVPVEGLDGEGDPDPDCYGGSDSEILEVFPDSDASDSSRQQQQEQLSSDDDPHLGQVTPGHLISPALRRKAELTFDEDPPSDDSMFGGGEGGDVSPSREVMLRRMQRTLSGSALKAGQGPTISAETSPMQVLRHLLAA